MAIRVPSRTRQRAYGYVEATSGIVRLACPVLVSPSANATLTATDSVTLEWSAMDDADQYHVYLWESDSEEPDAPNVTTQDTSYDFGGLSEDTTYSWKVLATNGQATSTGCGAREFTTANVLLFLLINENSGAVLLTEGGFGTLLQEDT